MEKLEQDLKLEILPEEVQIQLSEDEDEDTKKKTKKAHICLIKAGWNANDYYFTEDSLSEILQLMQNKPKLYVDHDFFGMGRSEKDWAASYISSSKDKNQLVGDIVFTKNPLTEWLYYEIERNPKEVQLSIDIRALTSEMDTPDGRTGRKVEKVLLYRSTDFVSYAAAGGEALRILNQKISDQITNITKNISKEKEMELTLQELKAKYPGLVSDLRVEFEAGNKTVDLQNSVNTMKTEVENLKNQVASLSTEKTTLSTQIENLQNEVKTITSERDALKLKVDEFETAEKINKWKSDIQNAIKESKIDEKLVSQVFLESLEKETDIAKVKSMIEDRKSIADPKFSIENGGPGGEEKKSQTMTEDELVAGIKS